MVAGEGLEPTTFGLSVPALCGARKPSGASSRTVPPPFDRGSFNFSLSPPPAAVEIETQRATLVVLITKGHSCKSFRCNETRKNDLRLDAVFLVWDEGPKKMPRYFCQKPLVIRFFRAFSLFSLNNISFYSLAFADPKKMSSYHRKFLG